MDEMAALRAEWFAQLAETIEDAQRVAWQLRTREDASSEARELYSRLEAARLELNSLRGADAESSRTFDADWLRALGWSGSLADRKD